MLPIYKVVLGRQLYLHKITVAFHYIAPIHLLVLDAVVIGTCEVEIFSLQRFVENRLHFKSATDKFDCEGWRYSKKCRIFLLIYKKFGLSDSYVV